MKVLFAGPSIHGLEPDLAGIELRPPAAQGDIARAALDGAAAIGLIDGLYEAVAAVWHKEILWALTQGVAVLGAASMGALRAAECAPFGMRPVGAIARRYLDGSLDDDAAVAIVHAPADLGSAPLCEALVDVEATLARLTGLALIEKAEAAAMWRAAEATFFKDRTVAAFTRGLPRAADLARLYAEHRFGAKQADAALLIEQLRLCPDVRGPGATAWQLARPAFWRRAEAGFLGAAK